MKSLSTRRIQCLSFGLLSFALLILPQYASAYPEMVRHGYANCVSCHANLGGGGVLNEYGRALSLEALSTWGSEKEAQTAYGLFTQPEWLSTSAEVRGLGMAIDTPTELTLSSVLMQADLEAAATVGAVTLVGTAGYYEAEGEFISRRHYAQYRLSDTVVVRGGKFFPVFGLMNAEHASFTRRLNGFDQAQESYNIEASYVGETFSGFIGAVVNSTDRSLYKDEKGLALSGALFLNNKFKVGLSFFQGSGQDDHSRTLLGAHAALGFTPRVFYLGEIDWAQVSDIQMWTSYQKIDFEPIQGVHLFLTDEWADTNTNTEGYTHRFGPGMQFFPRPHIELQLQAQWQSVSNLPAADVSLYTAMLNYYL